MVKISVVLMVSTVIMWSSIIPNFSGESDKVDNSFVRDDNKSIVIDSKNNKIYNDDSYGTNLTFLEANSYCAKMDYLGTVDWRLPSHEEMKSLLELSRRPIAIKHAFKNVQEGIYWTSTKDRRENAWYVDFDLGRYFTAKYDKKFFVLCVRDFKSSVK